MISKYFQDSEFACKCGCGLMCIDQELVYICDDLRETLDQPLVVNSGCRCAAYNAKVGGKSDSAHQDGLAVDLACADGSPLRYQLVAWAMHYGIKRIGVAKSFVHIDISADLPHPRLWTY